MSTWTGGNWNRTYPNNRFFVFFGQEEREILWSQQMDVWYAGAWVQPVRQAIANAFGIPQRCQLTLVYVDRNGNKAELCVICLFAESTRHRIDTPLVLPLKEYTSPRLSVKR
jgi:hypothetical protein